MSKLLLFFTGFVAITAIPCGVLLMIQPDGHLLQLDLNLVNHSILQNYFLPGLALSLPVGFLNLYASILNFKKHYRAPFWSGIGGLMIIVFEVVEMMVIQSYNWMQILYLLLGFFIVLMALQIKHRELI